MTDTQQARARETEWFRDLGDWQPAGKHTCSAAGARPSRRRVPDSPEAAAAMSSRSSVAGTPRTAGGGASARPDAFALLPAAFDHQQHQHSSSLPFWTPSHASLEERDAQGRQHRAARSVQRGGGGGHDSLSVQVPFQIQTLLEAADRQQERDAAEPISTLTSSTTTSWVAFAPITPEEVAPAVAAIVAAAGKRCVTRYLAEPMVASRLGARLPPAAAREPSVLAIHVFCTTREDAAGLLHAHERRPIFRSKLGEMVCAFTDPPTGNTNNNAPPLWCGRLELLAAATTEQMEDSNLMQAGESAAARELASRVRGDNVSVCQRLQVRQAVPMSLQLVCFARAYARRVAIAAAVVLVLWWWFFF